jgi:hypothetical protein
MSCPSAIIASRFTSFVSLCFIISLQVPLAARAQENPGRLWLVPTLHSPELEQPRVLRLILPSRIAGLGKIPDYQRIRIPGGTNFLTANLHDRQSFRWCGASASCGMRFGAQGASGWRLLCLPL